MKKADISFFALVFFITRCLFNLVKSPNLYFTLALFLFIIILLILISRINVKVPFILSIIYIVIGVFIIDSMESFIRLNYFTNISSFIIKIPLLILIYIMIDKNYSIKDTSEILFFIFLIVFIIVIVNSIMYVNPYNIVKFVSNTRMNFNYSHLIPVLSIFIFYGLKDDYIDTRSIIGYFILSVFTIFIEQIMVNGVLGVNVVNHYLYPTSKLVSKMPFFSFSNRLDYLLSLVFLFEGTVTLTYILDKVKKEKKLFLFLGIIILIIF